MPNDKAPEPTWVVVDHTEESKSAITFDGGGTFSGISLPRESHWECEGTNWIVKYLPDNPTVPICSWYSNENTPQGSE